jgi:histidinol phosphatase-like PHP family hydrolase
MRLIDFVVYNNLRFMNTFFNHKNIHKYTWSARNSKSMIDYFIANEKISKLFLDIKIYRGCETGSDHYLIQTQLRIPPKWL